jgi:hypothetical protein
LFNSFQTHQESEEAPKNKHPLPEKKTLAIALFIPTGCEIED